MGTESEEYSQFIKQKYLDVRDLLDKKSKSDPADQPYKSQYAARDLLCEIKTIISNKMDSNEERCIKDIAILSGVYMILGSISVEVDEPSTGEEYLSKALELIEGNEVHQDIVICTLATLNQLGLLWCQRGEDEKAFQILKQSEAVYHEFNDLNIPPTDFHKLFTGETIIIEKQSDIFYEKTHTLTLYYLAQVYRSLGQHLKSAEYCHTTLRRQLEMKDYDKIDWALNSATLSQFLLEKNAYKTARHHLSAASYVLDLKQTELDVIISEEEEHEANKEQLKHRKSDVARCWAKYGLMLMIASKNRLMASDDDATPTQSFEIPEELVDLHFPSLELAEYESLVPCDFLLTFDDARPVFLNAQEWLNKAKEYYTLSEHASDYICIQQDLSQLYLALTFFEEDESRQCKMHKRRTDILCSLVNEVNPTHYMRSCREIWYELGEIYIAMMEIKMNSMPEERTTHCISKINCLIQQGLLYFSTFIDSFRDHRTKKLPDIFPEEYERPVLLAHVYIGRLHTKIITADRKSLLDSTRSGYESYKFVVNYCSRRNEAKELMETELSICEEMAALLPLKMTKILEHIS